MYITQFGSYLRPIFLPIFLPHYQLKSYFVGAFARNTIELIDKRGVGTKCCAGRYVLSCSEATVDLDSIGNERITLPGNISLQLQGHVAENPNGYCYSGINGEALLTMNPAQTNSVYGHFAATDGRSFILEYCGGNSYVVKELDTASMAEEGEPSFDNNDAVTLQSVDTLIAEVDNSTIVEYSVKFYYTEELEADTADLDGFLQLVIDETNQGYVNSGIPLRIKAHCPQKVAIAESGNAGQLLNALTDLNNGNYPVTRDGADVAALIVLNLNYCGVAWFNTINSGATFSVTAKSCATGYYSFGHEIGHNIGAHHNPDVATNNAFPYGTGHLIEQGTASTGLRTIMAYNKAGYSTRVNYWSNPAVNHPLTGTPTGVAEVSNNAAVLTQQRFNLAMVGDETTGSCVNSVTTTGPVSTTNGPATTAPITNGPTTLAPTSPRTTTTPPTTTVKSKRPGKISCNNDRTVLKRFKRMRVPDAESCQEECQKRYENDCTAFNFKRRRCDLLTITYSKSKGSCTGKPFDLE